MAPLVPYETIRSQSFSSTALWQFHNRHRQKKARSRRETLAGLMEQSVACPSSPAPVKSFKPAAGADAVAADTSPVLGLAFPETWESRRETWVQSDLHPVPCTWEGACGMLCTSMWLQMDRMYVKSARLQHCKTAMPEWSQETITLFRTFSISLVGSSAFWL